MAIEEKTVITVQTAIKLPVSKVWQFWTDPAHIINWNFASEDWHCPNAINNPKPRGKFCWRMEAKDGSMGFDYSGVYLTVQPYGSIEKKLDDGRSVTIKFIENQDQTIVIEKFEADQLNSSELQQQGWQAILNNFKRYAEQQ